jgi:nitroreductase
MMGKKKSERKGREPLEEKLEKLGRKLEKVVQERAELMRSLRPALVGPAAEAESGEDAPSAWLSADSMEQRERGTAVPAMHEAMRARRSVKRFTDDSVPREAIERLLATAVHAPNHHMTEPWRFYVLGPHARFAWGEALGARKAKKIEDEAAAAQVLEKVARTHEALPAMIAVAMKVGDDPERAREDYAATWMAVQNLCLAAVTEGLGTHIKTGAIMDDPAARTAVGVPADERIVATLTLGVPEEVPAGKPRTSAAQLTTWVD